MGGAAGLFLSLRLLEGRGREARLAPLVLLYALLSHGVEYLLVLAYLALRGVRAPSIVAPSVAAAALAAPFPHLYVGGLYGAYLATVPISAVAAWTAPRLGLSRLVAAASRAVTAELVALYLLLMVGWLVDPPYLRMSRWVWGDPVVGVTRYRQLPPSKLPVLAGLPGYAALHALVHGVYVPRALMSLIIVGVVGYHTVWVYGYFSERFVGLAMPPYRPSP